MPHLLHHTDHDFAARLDALIKARRGAEADVAADVAAIIRRVREEGDAALIELTEKFDRFDVAAAGLKVTQDEVAAAVARIDDAVMAALRLAANRIRAYHERQLPEDAMFTDEAGVRMGHRFTPVDAAGLYVPGGLAAYPSSVLMNAIPAKVAGVSRLVMAVPTPAGRLNDLVLAAANLAGVDEIWRIGGAQAIAALAYGTKSIPRVDKIVGPGNLFVTLAKKQVYGIVGIDGLYGPTETVVVADESANPAWIAADMLAQAEHDVLATAILFTPALDLATAVQREIARQMEELSRSEIIAVSLANQGAIVLTADVAEACRLASDFAAEHTCIAAANPQQWVEQIPNAGGLFIGERSFEVLGDYVVGPSHVMPTGGTARFASPLNVADFVKISSLIELDDATSARLSPIAAQIAQAEGLTAHVNAAIKRIE